MRWNVPVVILLAIVAALAGAARPSPVTAEPLAATNLLDEMSLASSSRGLASVYTVQTGDSLEGIADLLSVDTQTLQQLNDLSDPSALQAGMVLVVPDVPTRPVKYGVVREQPHPNGAAPAFIWPAIGPITTKFGVPGSDWVGGFHMGLDIGAPYGAPIVAAAAGSVEEANGDNSHGYGNHVLISHGFGYETLYAHMSRIVARAGERVQQGQIIGYVGQSGYAFGPHLHFEVRRDSTKIDPEPLLPSR
ncbi:MAG: M23 family metallopeptidase [Chloroflexota bacterium]